MYGGTTRLGDIVINADSDPEGYDMLQDQFAGSEALDQQQNFSSGSGSDIQGGDDGVGVFGAARLRRRIRGGKQPSPDGGAPDIALPGGTPALAPSGGGPSIPAAPTTTDSAGGQLPADVLAALRGAITPTGGREAPTASQDVATQAEDAGGG